MRILGIIASAIQKAYASFSDTFNRITSTSLGTSSSGGLWEALRGTWFAGGSSATSSDAASTYPIASVKMSSSDVTANAKGTGQGTGISIWATDSGNWWAVVTGQNPGEDCNCSTCSTYVCPGGYNSCNCTSSNCSSTSCNSSNCASTSCKSYTCTSSSCNSNSCSGYSCGSSSCTSGTCSKNSCNAWSKNTKLCTTYSCTGYTCNAYYCIYYTCSSYSCNSYTCNASVCSSYNCNSYTCNASSCNSYTCNTYYCTCPTGYTSYYSCNCSTCYPPFIRVLQSVSNTVSEITKWVISSVANSIRVTTSGTTITTKAYSDSSQVSQIGSDLVYNANGAAVDTQFGIVVAPSSYSQGNTIDEVDFTAN